MKNNARPKDILHSNPYSISPAITTVAMPLLIEQRKKTSSVEQTAQEKPKKGHPKLKPTAIETYEVTTETLKFYVEKGLLKKRFVIVKEIPVYEISSIESLGNELSVTWKGATDRFVLKKKSASLSALREQIQGLLDEHRKTLEAQAKVANRKSDLTVLLNFSVGIVDSSFDMLMGLQFKPVNWAKLEIYANSLIEKTGFVGQTLAPLTLDFSKVAEAVKSEVPENASKEIFEVLKTVYVYFEELQLTEDIEQVHPNFKDAKEAILACFTLNDIWLGKIAGEKDSQKESQVLQGALQSLADDTSFNVNFEALKAGFDKIVPAAELESTIEDSREIFLGQLRNIDRPIEKLSAEHAPTAQPETPICALQELVQPPEPTVPMRPFESQALAQPPTLEPSIEPQSYVQPPVEPQSTIQPSTERAPVEQTEPVMLPESEQPPNLREPKVEPTPESLVVEQQKTAPPSSGETDVQIREHESSEVSVPTNEDVAKAPEVAPKKKSFGQRLRKSVMGY
jgi:hypothetical protein